MSRKIKVTDEEIIFVALNSKSAAAAASDLGIKYETFRVHAKRLGVFSINPSGKGLSKPKPEGNGKISLQEILEGKHPSYQSNKLRLRLISDGLKKAQCEVCNITEWNNKKVSFELEHKDGNRNNHIWNNLMIICPNCHSQTSTYRGKNKSGYGGTADTVNLKFTA